MDEARRIGSFLGVRAIVVRSIVWTTVLLFLSFAIGCGGGGGGGSSSNNTSDDFDDLVVASLDQYSESDYEVRSTATDAAGTASTYSDELGRAVEFEIEDDTGTPVPGIDIKTAIVGSTVMVMATSSDGAYTTVAQFDADVLEAQKTVSVPAFYDAGARTATKSIVIAATVLGAIKITMIVIAAYSAYKAGQKLGEALYELYDFHVDNFESASLSTITYRCTVDEAGEVVASQIKAGIALVDIGLNLATVGSTPGLTAAKRKVGQWAIRAMKETAVTTGLDWANDNWGAEFAAQGILDGLKAAYTDKADEIDGDTEIYLQVHYFHTHFDPYSKGISIGLVDTSQDTGDISDDLGNIIGYADIVPDSGPPGTSVTFDVYITSDYCDDVYSVVYYIDTTGEGPYSMVQTGDCEWTSGVPLTSPSFSTYPTLSNFTFFAQDAGTDTIGSGSTYFTTTAP